MALNNNAITTLLASAILQATGGADIAPLDVKNVIDNGTPIGESGFTLTKEKFTNALLDVVIKNWFTDSSYRSSYSDPYFKDSDTFGAYVQAISMEYPEATDSHAWKDFNGSTTVGTYNIYMPKISATMYGKTVSWEINISFTDEQWDTAFNNQTELNSFISYIHMMVDNAIVMHLEEMDYCNRNNYIAEKIAYSVSDGAVGVHVVNLVTAYNTKYGTNYTKSQYLSKAECIADGIATIKLYSDRFTKMSKLFNTESKDRFTPKDRQVLTVLADFENTAMAVMGNDSYNYNIVAMGENHVTVPYWQGSGETYDFADTSSVNIKTNSGDTAVGTGIVALLVDEWAIAHTIKSRRVVAKVFEPEAITTTFNQFRDMYSTNMSMNGVLFVLDDVAVESAE